MIDESRLEKIKLLILQREQIDRELEAILGDATPARRGRPRKEAGASTNGTAVPDNTI
jgi:hypothetical protein